MQTKSIKFIFWRGKEGATSFFVGFSFWEINIKKKKKKKMSTPKHFTELRENFKEAMM